MIVLNFINYFSSLDSKLRKTFAQIRHHHRKHLLLREQNRLAGNKYKKFKGEEEMKFLERSAVIFRNSPRVISLPPIKPVKWSDEKLQQFLELVEKNPIVYEQNPKGVLLCNLNSTKNEAWSKISARMNVDGKFILNSYFSVHFLITFFFFFLAKELRNKFSKLMHEHRHWLLKCHENRLKNKSIPIFGKEKAMKFLEDMNLKFLNLNHKKSSKKVVKKKIPLRETQNQDISLQEDEIEEPENLENITEIINCDEEEIPSQSNSNSISGSNSVESYLEANDLVKIAQDFTSYKFFSKQKQLEMQYSFKRMLLNYEEEMFKSLLLNPSQ